MFVSSGSIALGVLVLKYCVIIRYGDVINIHAHAPSPYTVGEKRPASACPCKRNNLIKLAPPFFTSCGC